MFTPIITFIKTHILATAIIGSSVVLVGASIPIVIIPSIQNGKLTTVFNQKEPEEETQTDEPEDTEPELTEEEKQKLVEQEECSAKGDMWSWNEGTATCEDLTPPVEEPVNTTPPQNTPTYTPPARPKTEQEICEESGQ